MRGGYGADEAYVMLGVSTSNAPKDLDAAPGDADKDWNFYSIPATHDFSTGLAWISSPKIAADADSLYITGDYYTFGSKTPAGSMIIRLDKTPLLNGTLGSRTDIVASSNTLSLQPVQSDGRGADQPQLFVDADPSSGIRVWELNDSNTLTTAATVATPFAEFTDGAPQPGTIATLNTQSSQLMNAVWRNDSLWTAHTVEVEGKATVRWYQIGTTGGTYHGYARDGARVRLQRRSVTRIDGWHSADRYTTGGRG